MLLMLVVVVTREGVLPVGADFINNKLETRKRPLKCAVHGVQLNREWCGR